MRAPTLLALGLLSCAARRSDADAARAASAPSDARLAFVRDGRPVRALALDALLAASPPETVAGFDPYYQRSKRFRALPLEGVLRAGFGAEPGALLREQFVLRAQDGYTVPIAGARLLEGGAYIAVGDLDVPAWEPIGPQRAHPGPFYLVWKYPPQQELEGHPRPWQLATIEIAAFSQVFPHTSPGDLPADAPASRGYAVFRELCVRCHAVNREGGRVGPELNVPQSIAEYRPEAQIRAYVRNPRTFRYGNMPPQPQLTDADLDGLMAYFRAMSLRKHDADAAPDGGAP